MGVLKALTAQFDENKHVEWDGAEGERSFNYCRGAKREPQSRFQHTDGNALAHVTDGNRALDGAPGIALMDFGDRKLGASLNCKKYDWTGKSTCPIVC